MCVDLCVQAHSGLCMHVWRTEALWLSFSTVFFLLFFSEGFSLNLGWPASSRDLSVSTCSSGVTGLCQYVVAGHLNSYLHSCIASTPPSHLHSPLRMVNRCIDFHQIHRPKFTQAAPICLYLLDPYFESFLRISFCCVGNTDDSVVPLAVLCSALQIRIADKAALLDRPCLCICSQLVDCPWGVRAHRRQDLRPELCLI